MNKIMIKVYIAGKLNDMAVDYNKNQSRMLKTALKVHAAGFSVFVPSMIEQLGILDGGWEYGDYFNNSQPWLEVSDAVFLVPGWETSEGTKAEIATAERLGIPVFDCIREMKKEFQEVKV